jgi:GxxExxY protein
MEINEITGIIVDSAMKVHTALGPGLLESVYERCLVHELRKRGLRTASQLPLPVVYDGEIIEGGYRLDILVEAKSSLKSRQRNTFLRFTPPSFIPS